LKETTLGRSGLKVKVLGFGGIPIQRVSEEEAISVVRRCHELGINYYDTARGYTNSEERIGKALEGIRDEVFLATKSGRRTADELLAELETSLRNLRTDWVDVYQLHGVSSREAWEQIKGSGGALEAMYQALDEGRIRHLGITSHDPAILAEIVREDIFETIMIPYNYLTPKPEEELLPLCREMDVGTIVMKPFGGGAFSNVNTALKFVITSGSPRGSTASLQRTGT
jgi:aryl-alcohol dehydrogenase-like predicted oxidoreductase